MRKGKSHELSLGQLYLSGAGAGVGNSIAVGPVEHLRSESFLNSLRSATVY